MGDIDASAVAKLAEYRPTLQMPCAEQALKCGLSFAHRSVKQKQISAMPRKLRGTAPLFIAGAVLKT
jgi:hypothetical protein